MPRPKTLPDADVLEAVHRLIHEAGPEALTFANVAERCGLSASTLVQRFSSKAEMLQAALLHAWDKLDAQTEALAAKAPMNPQGAVRLLVGLSGYGGIEAYANGLLVLREDLRDPVLRARGAQWKRDLCRVLKARFANVRGAPHGIGLMMAAQWQGALLWWSFEPKGKVERFIEDNLKRFVATIVAA